MAVRGRSIQWRITMWLLPLLAVVFAVAMFWLSVALKSDLYEANMEIVRRSSLTAVRTVEASMSGSGEHRHWNWLAQKIPPQEGSWIQIMDSRGNLVFSTSPADWDPPVDLRDPSCAPCHAGDPVPLPRTAIVPGPMGESYQILAAPLANGGECRVCHEPDRRILGVVLAGQSVEPINRQVRTVQLGIALAGIVVFLLTLLTTQVVVGRLLGRPLLELVKGARSIGAGDLDHAIELTDTTELSVLAGALNSSRKRLGEMVRRVERQRDEFETLYRFTDQLSRAVRPEERRLRAVELATQFLGAECVFVQADYRPETRTGAGTITLRGAEGFEEHAFQLGPDSREGLPTFVSKIVQRWLSGEFDGTDRVAEGWLVGYPVQREGRHLGLLLLPASRDEGDEGEASSAPDDDLVRALCRHIATALEFSEMQNELVAQARLAAIGETIAGLSHCLKNALNGLRAGQFITDRAVARNNAAKLRRGWGITKTGIRQIEALALDMLYFVKERKPKREPIDPNAIVMEVVELLRETASASGVELRPELDEKLGAESLDRNSVYRAVLNLVTNAMDACTESETGDLVVIRTGVEDDEILIEVEDNGVGMSSEIRSHLFTRFFSTKAGKGTGLGLPVVKKIVEEHGGGLEVESEPGRGSSFRLRLPRTS